MPENDCGTKVECKETFPAEFAWEKNELQMHVKGRESMEKNSNCKNAKEGNENYAMEDFNAADVFSVFASKQASDLLSALSPANQQDQQDQEEQYRQDQQDQQDPTDLSFGYSCLCQNATAKEIDARSMMCLASESSASSSVSPTQPLSTPSSVDEVTR